MFLKNNFLNNQFSYQINSNNQILDLNISKSNIKRNTSHENLINTNLNKNQKIKIYIMKKNNNQKTIFIKL